MESHISRELREYTEMLEAQLAEAQALKLKNTKAGALRLRKRSLLLDKANKAIRKTTIAEIG